MSMEKQGLLLRSSWFGSWFSPLCYAPCAQEITQNTCYSINYRAVRLIAETRDDKAILDHQVHHCWPIQDYHSLQCLVSAFLDQFVQYFVQFSFDYSSDGSSIILFLSLFIFHEPLFFLIAVGSIVRETVSVFDHKVLEISRCVLATCLAQFPDKLSLNCSTSLRCWSLSGIIN